MGNCKRKRKPLEDYPEEDFVFAISSWLYDPTWLVFCGLNSSMLFLSFSFETFIVLLALMDLDLFRSCGRIEFLNSLSTNDTNFYQCNSLAYPLTVIIFSVKNYDLLYATSDGMHFLWGEMVDHLSYNFDTIKKQIAETTLEAWW